MATKKKGTNFDLDAAKRLEMLRAEKVSTNRELCDLKYRIEKAKTVKEANRFKPQLKISKERLQEIDERILLLTSQATIVECDDKPIRIQALSDVSLEDKLARSYCAKCASPDLKITRIIQIECRKCGRKRLITSRLDESKR